LVALLYLSGRRILEILPLRKMDFNRSNPDKISFKTLNEKTFRLRRVGKYIIERHGDFVKNTVNGPVRYTTRFYELIEPEFSLIGPSGRVLGHYVLDYLDSLGEGDFLFPPYRASKRTHINQPRAYNVLRKMDGRLWLHAVRHINFTRMAKVFEEDPLSMHSLTFHKRFDSTMSYIHIAKKERKLNEL